MEVPSVELQARPKPATPLHAQLTVFYPLGVNGAHAQLLAEELSRNEPDLSPLAHHLEDKNVLQPLKKEFATLKHALSTALYLNGPNGVNAANHALAVN